jgi:carbon monoxide dehydrogenase subunit G
MHFEGNHTLDARREAVWELLIDPDVLARISPGVKELIREEGDRYKAVFQVKVGPVNGKFNGVLEVADKVPPERYTLKITQSSSVGSIKGEFVIAVRQEDNGQCSVSFNGDAKIRGVIAGIGQRVLSGVAKSQTAQFFKALEAEVAATT